jgi:hypothetical protein
MHDGLLAEHCRGTPTEEMLVFKIAAAFFSFSRAENFLSARLGSSDDIGDAKEVALLMRYQSATDRNFNRKLNDLHKPQKERRCPRVQRDATTYPSAARSETPALILPTSHVQLGDIGCHVQSNDTGQLGSFRQLPAQRKAATYRSKPPRVMESRTPTRLTVPLRSKN